GGRSIADLRLSTRLLTPNGDGINDHLEVSLVVLKGDGQVPRVSLYDLQGRLVSALEPAGVGAFRWAGQDLQGRLVQPGVYVLRVELKAQAGAQVQTRALAVAY
ncbi:MAG: gliding motility-associated C-terminal domain-containing protein, partial [Candidatus Handelsmanbacteria bacterium]|nr:gliding motility-associated C-terminal domain-containing protein [Candidatus Handelsmanbacteria bacterium]